MVMVVISLVTIILFFVMMYLYFNKTRRTNLFYHSVGNHSEHSPEKLLHGFETIKSTEEKLKLINTFFENLSFKSANCEFLTKRFRHEEDCIKTKILGIIKQSRYQEQFVTGIKPYISEFSEEIKLKLITLLEIMIVPEVKEILLSMTFDKSQAIRENSIFGLKKFLKNDVRIRDRFIELLKDPSKNIRINVIKGLSFGSEKVFLDKTVGMYPSECAEGKSVLLSYFKQCKIFKSHTMLRDSYNELPEKDRTTIRDILLESDDIMDLNFVQSKLSRVDTELKDTAAEIVEKGLIKAGFSKDNVNMKVKEIQNSFTSDEKNEPAIVNLPSANQRKVDSATKETIEKKVNISNVDEINNFLNENLDNESNMNYLANKLLDENDSGKIKPLLDNFAVLPQQTRYNIIMKIGENNWKQYCEFLKDTFTAGESYLIRSACINSLCRLDIEIVFHSLQEFLDDTSHGVLFTAASNLYRHYKTDFTTRLEEILISESSNKIKKNILNIIERFSLDIDDKLLLMQLDQYDTDIKNSVIDIFLKKGKFEYVDIIIDSFKKKNTQLEALWKKVSKQNYMKSGISNIFSTGNEHDIYAALVTMENDQIQQYIHEIEKLKSTPSKHIKAIVIKKLWAYYGEKLDLSQFFEEKSDIITVEIVSIIKKNKLSKYNDYLLSLISHKTPPAALLDAIDTIELLKIKKAIPKLKAIKGQVPNHISSSITKALVSLKLLS